VRRELEQGAELAEVDQRSEVPRGEIDPQRTGPPPLGASLFRFPVVRHEPRL
jgi:hypothetical protein